jgi:5-methylcytosine-specific restriction enzyme subunit McrC
MKQIELRESQSRLLALPPATADALGALSYELRSRSVRPGAADDEENNARTIRCEAAGDGRYRLTVSNAIGVIETPDLRVLVEPKIPRAHLFYLFGLSDAFPQVSASSAHLAEGEDLWRLVCRWFMDALEAVLRGELVLDYVAHRAPLAFVRGTPDMLATSDAYYSGRLDLICDYEDFSADTALNRVMRAALRTVAGSDRLPLGLRTRSVRALGRFSTIGDLQPEDLRVRTDRRTSHYGPALLFANHILAARSLTLRHGQQRVWSFLIRTPDLVEAGVRNVLRIGLADVVAVHERSFALSGTKMRMYPDLVFGDVAVGDVKYKLTQPTGWARPDLNQAVAFAAAARRPAAAIISFHVDASLPPSQAVGVGDIEITGLTWNSAPSTPPGEAAIELCQDARKWLETVSGAPEPATP